MIDDERMSDELQTQRDVIFSKRNEDVLAMESDRRRAEAEKTARLRALRLAKGAGERTAKAANER
jgi:hypothetical protein